MLPGLFFLTAILYACVGFGGGSTYTAILVLADTDYRILPVISLTCNILVVAGGVWRFGCEGQIDLKKIWPWCLLSVPMALLGGFYRPEEVVFIGVLGFSLLFAGVRMILPRKDEASDIGAGAAGRVWPCARAVPFILGGGLGFLSGMTGIGGGIFLSPVLYFMRWGGARAIAGACSLFILVNSVAGLSGHALRMINNREVETIALAGPYLLLFPAVVAGGALGSWLGSSRLDPRMISALTGVLILYVALRLIQQWYGIVAGRP